MFSFQDTPGRSINPKDFWMENCNLNERYLWLNNQDIEPLWLKGVRSGAIACIGCKTYFFCSLSIEETLKNI